MARPSKIGLDYFPFDVDMFDDEKLIPISSEFGAKGECVVVRMLCAIYRNGYFAECSDAFKFKISRQAGVSAELVASVISKLVKTGFLDGNLFNSLGIITSRGIQSRWKEATRRRVSKGELDYWLIDGENVVSDDRNPRNSEFMYTETPLTRTETPQIKLKESKVNNNNLSLAGTPASEKERESFFEIFFFKNFINPMDEVDRFCSHYEASGWIRKDGRPVVNRIALAKTWEQREKEEARFSKLFLDSWEKIYEETKKKEPEFAKSLICEVRGASVSDSRVVLFVKDKDAIEAIEALVDCFSDLFKELFDDKALAYRTI